MYIVVTGAAGFVGANLVRGLNAHERGIAGGLGSCRVKNGEEERVLRGGALIEVGTEGGFVGIGTGEEVAPEVLVAGGVGAGVEGGGMRSGVDRDDSNMTTDEGDACRSAEF